MSTDVKGSKILARTFFNQLRSSGYTPHQIIGVATELIDLVTNEIREADKAKAELVASETAKPELRHSA